MFSFVKLGFDAGYFSAHAMVIIQRRREIEDYNRCYQKNRQVKLYDKLLVDIPIGR